jgi:hypothetical protein
MNTRDDNRDCLDQAVLAALLKGALDAQQVFDVETHLESCERCQVRLAQLGDGDACIPESSVPKTLLQTPSKGLAEVMAANREGLAPATRAGVPDTELGPIGGVRPFDGVIPRAAQTIGEYEVLAVLGRGGLGVVYRATDRALTRDVAIKLLHPSLADDEALRERFLREARAAAALRHDNVVTVYGIGEHAGQPYLVMEYVPGGSLADRLVRKQRLDSQEIIQLGVEVAAALAAAHARGIIHRDVKPGNVLWDAEASRYKLADFGLAKAVDDVGLTRTGTLVGTPEYLSPEQAMGKAADARSDLFSLGCMLYAACTGESQFHADSTMAVLHRLKTHTPADVQRLCPDCPPALARLIHRLLAKEPKRRYSTASEVVDDLQQLASTTPRAATAMWPVGRARRRAVSPTAIGLAVVLCVAAAAVWYRQNVGNAPAAVGAAADHERPFFIPANSQSYQTLGAAIAAAPADGVIEVRRSGRIPVSRIAPADKAITIRAAQGSQPILSPAGDRDLAGPAITTSANLILEGFALQWVAPSDEDERGIADDTAQAAIVVHGGELLLRRCDVLVGRRDTCVRLAGASCTIADSRLSARRGTCVAWLPRADSRLRIENSVLSGGTCLSIDSQDRTGELPAALEIAQSTWQARKGVELILSFAPRLPIAVRAQRNVFALDHLLVMYWPYAGPRALKSPSLQAARGRLRQTISWEERENLYGAKTQFLSRESMRQAVAPLDAGPNGVGEWEAFWNRPGTGSQQGDAGELAGKVGAQAPPAGL